MHLLHSYKSTEFACERKTPFTQRIKTECNSSNAVRYDSPIDTHKTTLICNNEKDPSHNMNMKLENIYEKARQSD